eukprot:205663-Chlamydomonas_euryale.AAC.3
MARHGRQRCWGARPSTNARELQHQRARAGACLPSRCCQDTAAAAGTTAVAAASASAAHYAGMLDSCL